MELLQSTPLIDRHLKLGALMAPFGGWQMPIQYEGILAEHRACREKAALFDICHMGEFLFTGDFEQDGLESVFTFSVVSIPVGRSRYGFLLNEQGGIIDDLIVFRLAQHQVMIVTNAATTARDFAVIGSRLSGGDFVDISLQTGKLDLQGPLARDVITRLLEPAAKFLPYFRFMKTTILGADAILSRTGYTGELGYELFVPSDRVDDLWDLLLEDDRVKPAGLGARDLLRLEMGYSLYGNDLSEEITPLEAGLESFVRLEKDFVGRGALLALKERGLPQVKIAFRCSSRRSPRHGYDIMLGTEKVGVVTSGGFSPMLSSGIGLGLVQPKAALTGTKLHISDGRVTMEGEVCSLPFYTANSLRS